MAPPTKTVLGGLLMLTSVTFALPQNLGKIDTAMPFLHSTATIAAAVQDTSSPQLWTPAATQSQWDWQTWQSSATAIVATPVVTSRQSVPYSNPFTIYTTMTDSRGVITGMPAVATSQPSQAAAASVCSGCSSVLSQQASWSSMVGSLYTTTKAAASTANATSTGMSSSSSATPSATFRPSTGGASQAEVFGGSAILAMVGAVAALL